MKTVCLFAIHRTGTNYLVSVLRQWPALDAFAELFHPDRVHGLRPAHLKALSATAGLAFDDPAAPAFVEWMRTHPLQAVETLRRVARRKERAGVFFKVFLGQWKAPLGEVVPGLAAGEGFTAVVLQRRCIDAYVSYRKAEAAGQYRHVDTTQAPVRLEPQAYARWAAQARAWYADVTRALAAAGVRPVLARYEADVDLPPQALSAHWSALLGLPGQPDIDPATALARQDRNDRIEDKIANADEFFSGLEALGLREESRRGFLDT